MSNFQKQKFEKKIGVFQQFKLVLSEISSHNRKQWGVQTFTFGLDSRRANLNEEETELNEKNIDILYDALKDVFYYVRGKYRKRNGPYKVGFIEREF